MNRWTRPVNVTLLVLMIVATGSGALAFGVGAVPATTVVVAVHGASGLGLLLLVPAKYAIVRRGLRRPGRSRKVVGLALAALVVLAVGSGLLHALGGFRGWLGLLPMQIHVGAALIAVVPLVTHMRLHRRWGLLRRTDLDRRVALRGAVVVAGVAALWAVTPGRERRSTGSHEVAAAVMPVTQWMFDPVPRIAARDWRLRIPGGAPDVVDLAALAALPQLTVRAVIDCTGGWYAEQEWRGVPLTALGLPAGASIEAVSATGYRRRFPTGEALLLATHAGGRPLSAGHGGPARLVAPGRRGFWWVKWVVAVEVVDEPWWWQPPFPLQ